MIHYQVSFDHANQHLLQVKLTISQPLKQGQEFWLPDWLPGSYMIRDFSRNIQWIKASCKGESCQLTKLSKSTWQLEQAVDELQLIYPVYAWDLSVRAAHFDPTHCFFNGSSVFLAIRGLEAEPHQVELEKNKHCIENHWQVATSMPALKLDQQGFGDYLASNYAELIDHPFEIAAFSQVEFELQGVMHKLVFTEAPKNIDLQRIAADVKKICEQIGLMFDDDLPFEHYYFLTLVLKKGFGGLEHRASTALHTSRSDLPLIGESKDKKSAGYKSFLALCSHEYFHAWNVKRIKPARFKDYLLQEPVHTSLLWFFEGITSYYDELMLVRAGVIDETDYLDMIAKNISRYLRGIGRKHQTISESSFDAWTRFYQQDENAPNAIVSYYVKGGLIAMLLDQKIQAVSNNQQSLDDLMRLLWQKQGKLGKGVGEQRIQELAAELVNEPLEHFFAELLETTQDLPILEYFDTMGINCQLLSESKSMETGGFVDKPLERQETPSLFISHKTHSVGAEVISVFHQGCGSKSGISNKDIIIAIDGLRVDSSDLDAQIARYQIGDKVQVSLFRRDKLYHLTVQLQSALSNTCFLSYAEQSRNKAYKRWMANSRQRIPQQTPD